jgi:hypothetical protein
MDRHRGPPSSVGRSLPSTAVDKVIVEVPAATSQPVTSIRGFLHLIAIVQLPNGASPKVPVWRLFVHGTPIKVTAPQRAGKPLERELPGSFSARRRPYRVLQRIDVKFGICLTIARVESTPESTPNPVERCPTPASSPRRR